MHCVNPIELGIRALKYNVYVYIYVHLLFYYVLSNNCGFFMLKCSKHFISYKPKSWRIPQNGAFNLNLTS